MWEFSHMEAHAVVVADSKSRVTLKGVRAGQKFRVEREADIYRLEPVNAGLPRLTNVEPLPASVWRRIYSRPDELAGVTAAQLTASQVQEEPT